MSSLARIGTNYESEFVAFNQARKRDAYGLEYETIPMYSSVRKVIRPRKIKGLFHRTALRIARVTLMPRRLEGKNRRQQSNFLTPLELAEKRRSQFVRSSESVGNSSRKRTVGNHNDDLKSSQRRDKTTLPFRKPRSAANRTPDPRQCVDTPTNTALNRYLTAKVQTASTDTNSKTGTLMLPSQRGHQVRRKPVADKAVVMNEVHSVTRHREDALACLEGSATSHSSQPLPNTALMCTSQSSSASSKIHHTSKSNTSTSGPFRHTFTAHAQPPDVGYIGFKNNIHLSNEGFYSRESMSAANFYQAKSRGFASRSQVVERPKTQFEWSDVRIRTPDFFPRHKSHHETHYSRIESDIFDPVYDTNTGNPMRLGSLSFKPVIIDHPANVLYPGAQKTVSFPTQTPATTLTEHRSRVQAVLALDLNKPLPPDPPASQERLSLSSQPSIAGVSNVRNPDMFQHVEAATLHDRKTRFPIYWTESRMEHLKKHLRYSRKILREMTRKD